MAGIKTGYQATGGSPYRLRYWVPAGNYMHEHVSTDPYHSSTVETP